MHQGRKALKREEKNALTRQRIVDAAMEEFAHKGYERASLNEACAGRGFSKGIIYHYFRDKDELYLLCVQLCFDEMTAALQQAAQTLQGPAGAQLQAYFDARNRFFAGHPLHLGLFVDASFDPPAALAGRIRACRSAFDALNLAVLQELLQARPLRPGISAETVAEDLRLYMDALNSGFRAALREGRPAAELLREHEERSRRYIDILLYGVLEERDERS